MPETVPIRYAHHFMCGFVISPPTSLAEWRQRADVVMHVRIETQSGFERTVWPPLGAAPSFPELFTAHEATVLTLIKGDQRATVEGGLQQILQHGGQQRKADHILIEVMNGFEMMPIGSEWVLFLAWDGALDGFTLFYRENGAVEIRDGKVSASGKYHRSLNGRPVEELIDALRR